jgi:sugar lactone lactonase YvrE
MQQHASFKALLGRFVIAASACLAASAQADVLYIADNATHTVKRFDADTGAALDAATPPALPGSPPAPGPLGGIVVRDGILYLASQARGGKPGGQIQRYDAASGQLLDTLVSARGRNPPTWPAGLLVDGNVLVADLGQAEIGDIGRIRQYGLDGTWLGDLPAPGTFPRKEFHPIAMVGGPDGLIYASVQEGDHSDLGGRIVRIRPDGTAEAFIVDRGGRGRLNRPEGLTFGPDGRLYVTSARADKNDTDSIRVYDGASGSFVGKIDLYQAVDAARDPRQRAYARALLFGPAGFLVVPIAGPVDDSPNRRPKQRGHSTGEVRRYDPATLTLHDVLIRSNDKGQPLGEPRFFTFGATDARTLQYTGAPPGPVTVNLERCFCNNGTSVDVCAVVNCDSGLEQDAICGPACAGNGGELATACFPAEPVCN